jgi:hypothetical protein
MDAATAAAANAHPTQKFAIVDDAPVAKKTHVLALQYETDQGGFLGGYSPRASKSGHRRYLRWRELPRSPST